MANIKGFVDLDLRVKSPRLKLDEADQMHLWCKVGPELTFVEQPHTDTAQALCCHSETMFVHHTGKKSGLCNSRRDVEMLTHPLCRAARGSLLLFTLIMSREKSRKNMAIPKHTRYTDL